MKNMLIILTMLVCSFECKAQLDTTSLHMSVMGVDSVGTYQEFWSNQVNVFFAEDTMSIVYINNVSEEKQMIQMLREGDSFKSQTGSIFKIERFFSFLGEGISFYQYPERRLSFFIYNPRE